VRITVAGEALIDLIVDAGGGVRAFPGGAPFNVARAIAWLGGDCQFLGRTGDDAFGARLRAALNAAGVRLGVAEAARRPSTLAVAEIDADGAAAYHFYLDGTAAAALSVAELSDDVVAGTSAIALGGLALLMEPIAGTLRELLARSDRGTTVVLDPNCRPQALPADRTFAELVDPFLNRADVLKVSTDDLRLLAPGTEPLRAARALLARGPGAVLVTDGPGAVTMLTRGEELAVPVPAVPVVDTVGAGDAFAAGFLTWWVRAGRTRADLADAELVRAAVEAAVRVAAAACTVAGAGLPPDFSWEA
jgi:fructokinase